MDFVDFFFGHGLFLTLSFFRLIIHTFQSSGSGSESGTQTQKSVKSKSIEKSGNFGSDDGEKDASNGLNVGDGSDDGSGAQVVHI